MLQFTIAIGVTLSLLLSWSRISGFWTAPRRLIVVAITVHILLLAHAAFNDAPTFDEPAHLAAGLRYWCEGTTGVDPGNPPVPPMVAAAPVAFLARGLKTDERITREWLRQSIHVVEWIQIGRLAQLPLIMVGTWVCYRWSRDLFGPRGALISLLLWCFNPSVLGHGHLITADIPAASFAGLSMYTFWKWLKVPTARRAIVAGLALGAAELMKMVCIFLYCLIPVVWMAWELAGQFGSTTQRFRIRVIHLVVLIVVSIICINFGYALAGIGTRDGEDDSARPLQPPESDSAAWYAKYPLPLPKGYIGGLYEVRKVLGRDTRLHVAEGKWVRGGVWYYYVYGLLLTIPAGTWLMGAIATWRTALARNRFADRMVVIAAFLGFVDFVSIVARSHNHVRYSLPSLPFLIIFAGGAVSYIVCRRSVRLATGGLIVWSICSSLAAYPHSLSYFNELAGGPENGNTVLSDSSFDWGQDLFYLRRWCTQHPEAKPLSLAYFGIIDPAQFGLDYQPCAMQGDQPPRSERWYAISVALAEEVLPGQMYPKPGRSAGAIQRDALIRFLRMKPVGRAGYSIRIYREAPRIID